MGNFEKLGILVIIMLVVVILVLTVWGVGQPVDELGARITPHELDAKGGNGQGGASDPIVDNIPPAPPGPPAPSPWPDDDRREPPQNVPNPVPVPTPDADLTYVVKERDSFYRIALHFYQDGSKFQVIQDANPDVDARTLSVGTTLVIPHPNKVLANAPRPAPLPVRPPVPAGSDTYVVQKGDSLWRIAEKTLGSGTDSVKILEANRDLLSGDGSEIQVGMTLRIPR